ncbi:MAG: hypothetical protein EA421_01470 [Gemmatimonadales bacterium]|nr:MAG: hypothetical protein EA421_01470 [Gemmatimonadales bacterium]
MSGILGVGSGAGALERGEAAARDLERLKRSSSLMESEFVSTLFRVMRETVPQESPGSDGAAEVFWSLMEREVADRFALAGGYGLGATLQGALEDIAGLSRGEGDDAAPSASSSDAGPLATSHPPPSSPAPGGAG